MNRFMYIGPTILGVATRNTVYEEPPAGLQAAIKSAPYMAGLCVPLGKLREAMAQIQAKSGAFYTLYTKALAYSAQPKGEN